MPPMQRRLDVLQGDDGSIPTKHSLSEGLRGGSEVFVLSVWCSYADEWGSKRFSVWQPVRSVYPPEKDSRRPATTTYFMRGDIYSLLYNIRILQYSTSKGRHIFSPICDFRSIDGPSPPLTINPWIKYQHNIKTANKEFYTVRVLWDRTKCEQG